MTESAQNNVRGAPIAKIRNPVCGGTPRTPHTLGAKWFNLGFFCPHVCGLSHFEDLMRFKKSISVYPALPGINSEVFYKMIIR